MLLSNLPASARQNALASSWISPKKRETAAMQRADDPLIVPVAFCHLPEF